MTQQGVLGRARRRLTRGRLHPRPPTGIPDFRSPGGLYSSLAQMPQLNLPLPTPEAIFSLDYFRVRPPSLPVHARLRHADGDMGPWP